MSRTIYFDDIVVGLEFESAARTIGEADIITFAGLSGDFNALHTDAEFAATTHFGQRVAHGMLIASISTGLRSDLDDFAMLAFLNTNRSFSKPVFIGDTVRIRYRVNSTEPSTSGASRGVVRLGLDVVKQDGTITQTGEDTILVATRPKENP
ncbi:hypothetical protein FFI94_032420 [Rhodococcus sp. KBS0724]|uniref:MaoC/PaaZ C-terminal domain-containing protein n=1 Tax=Rhodococcus sp. KBS0724 TaxID=1179674 RepID=UPI00110D8FA4|nr:MaoC/PaaZ C-terminal domain-containing protein [Rhodococcus sp. KBS0724]TSD40416.1 hypothetical protein FFI94_032420 [Rhodococcus sp. KBS0724]